MDPLAAISPRIAAPTGQIDAATARQVAEEFEAVFLSTMMGHMFAGLETDGPFGGGHAESNYRSLLVEEYGKAIAASGGIGIADEVARELLAIQEAVHHDDIP